MPSLTDPITGTNINARFLDYVRAAANQGILWGTNNVPFPNFLTPTSTFFSGPTSGWEGPVFPNVTDGLINATNFFNYFVGVVFQYSRIKRFRIRISVTTTGGSPWNQSVTGPYYAPFSFDETNIAHLAVAYQSTLDYNRLPGGRKDILLGRLITDENIEDFFDRCRTLYYTLRDEVAEYQAIVCHASCHSSCHDSRVRR